MDVISPSGYGSLTVFLLVHINAIGSTVSVAQYGVTDLSVAIVGILWIFVPILIAFGKGRKSD